MFNWFRRSSKSASGVRKAASPVRRPPVSTTIPMEIDPQSLARLPPGALKLSPDAQRILATLPPAVTLRRSCAQYPQAVEKLLRHWSSPADFRRAIDSMVLDTRGGRRGFPFDIVSEFGSLREHYDTHVSPVKTTVWEATHAR